MMCKALILTLLIVTFLICPTVSQAQQKKNYQKKIGFEIVAVENAYVLTDEECLGSKIVSVYVTPEATTEEFVSTIAKRIASTYPDGYDLTIILTADRKFAQLEHLDSEEEKAFLSALRGVFVRSSRKKVEKMFAFPNGTTEENFDLITGGKEN